MLRDAKVGLFSEVVLPVERNNKRKGKWGELGGIWRGRVLCNFKMEFM